MGGGVPVAVQRGGVMRVWPDRVVMFSGRTWNVGGAVCVCVCVWGGVDGCVCVGGVGGWVDLWVRG